MIYLDLLIISNFLLDYSILSFVGNITQETIKIRRLILATIVAVASLSLFYIPIPSLFVIGRILFSLLIVYVAFPFTTIKKFIIHLVIFYGVSYIMAGVLISFNLSSKMMQIDFFDGKVWLLLIISFILANVLTYILKVQLAHHQLYYPIKIYLKDKEYQLLGYLDTGNEAFSHHLPIVFVSKKVFDPYDREELMSHLIFSDQVTLHTLNSTTNTLVFKPQHFLIKKGRTYQPVDVLLSVIEGDDYQSYDVILNKYLFY